MSQERVQRRRAPGWYRDPDDPTRFRHWSGRGWSEGRRAWPAWDVSGAEVVADPTLPGGPDAGAAGAPRADGPVQVGPLPAPGRRPVGTGVAWLARPEPAARSHTLQAGRRPAHRSAGVDAGREPSRRPVMVFAALVALALLVMAVSVGASRPQARNVVAADTAYVADASAVCASSLAPLHESSMSAQVPTPAEQARDATRAADVVAHLAGDLRHLAPSADAAAAVATWIATLDAYAADQRSLAAALTTPPAPAATGDGVTALSQRIGSDVTRADSFAATNALPGCRIGTTGTGGDVIGIP